MILINIILLIFYYQLFTAFLEMRSYIFKLDALKYGFSHVSKSSNFATECRKLVEKRAEQRTWLYYLGSITQ